MAAYYNLITTVQKREKKYSPQKIRTRGGREVFYFWGFTRNYKVK